MSFSESELERIEEQLNGTGALACPNCGATDWSTVPYAGAIVSHQQSGVNIFKTMQVVQRVCDSCGYVAHFSASKLGVEQQTDPPEKIKSRRR